MQLVEQHLIKLNNKYYQECDRICLAAKNLYNSCLYLIRQAYFLDKTNLLYNLHELMKDTEQYKALPAKVSSGVLLTVQKNFKAYFKSINSYYKYLHKFKARPGLPYYLDKIDGRFVAWYTNQAISKIVYKKKGLIKLSLSNIEFKSKIEFKDIDCVRIIPRISYYVIEVVYTIPDVNKLENNARYAAIDLGVNNLATLVNNIGINPVIYNGKPLKSINQYYNKKQAEYRSLLETRNKQYTSKKIKKLNLKRKNKVDNYLHKTSKLIVQKLKKSKINTLVIGKNDNWKQDVNLGKRSNQNFVNIPHSRFISMLTYKCEREGINVITQEESYTSKASFLNMDFIPTYGSSVKVGFSGYRYRRGLYKIRGKKIYINADVNGAYNILRKAIPTAFSNGIEGIGVCPAIIKIAK